MKFIHVADIHASRERLPQTLSILNTLTERCKKGDIDFIVFAGDFWDSTITATKGSGFSDIIAAIRKLEKLTYLVFVYGTPSHEPKGSLDAFASERCYVASEFEYGFQICTFCNFVLIPELRRSDYVAESSEKVTALMNKTIKKFIKAVKFDNGETPSAYRVPTVVVYHGEVKGAVYQNGVTASSPTAIPIELLQSLNADYYALGHIHMPQQIFPNAWYPGSACPKNFGEPHDGCYNLVEFNNGKTTVERVSFELPVYETYNVFFGDFAKTTDDYSNKHIRLQFDCTKEEKKALNIKQISEEIKKNTNALSVKLEPTVIECDTTERSEVVKHKSIVEKMIEYAKEKILTVPKFAKELLQDIEDNTLIKLAYPQHSFELLSLSLRGAIGIRDGQHKEDFDINFESYEDGVICLVGPCGHGKSTLIENCHPYPRMLTREGTLKDHFYLKDSHRILIYKDENKLYYKISMLIDGKTATGKASYYVETSKDRESWKPLPDVDGSLEAYKTWVEQTFGSVDVFLRTAFFAKEQVKNTPDIADTTKSERMELLSKLAGTNHLKEVSNVAKELRKEVEKSVEKIETEISAYSKFEENIKSNEEEIKTWNKELEGQKVIVSDLEKAVSELKVKDAEYQKVKAVSEANSALCSWYQCDLNNAEMNLRYNEDALENIAVIQNIKEYKKVIDQNTKKCDENQKKLNDLTAAIEATSEELSNQEKLYNEEDSQYNKIEADIKLISSQIIPIDEICPTCGAKLSDTKIKELSIVVEENKQKLANLKKEQNKHYISEEAKAWVLVPLKSKIDELKKECLFLRESISSMSEESQKNQKYIDDNSSLQEFTLITEDDIKNNINIFQNEIIELKSKIEAIADTATVKDVSEELSEAESKLKREQNHLAELNANIKAAEKENDKYRKELESVESKKAELEELTEKVIAYNFIEEAFSNNGIPAIELRESAPEIADITNKILADSYGNKFEIRFGSTSELKAKRKVNEDFNIIVLDTENGDEKTIDLVSSGERIWIKQALFYAFSIVQMNRTGFNFRTRLIDESDGSLDGSLRPKYLNMVTSAHQIANSRITVLITHSQEIKDIAQQIIEI